MRLRWNTALVATLIAAPPLFAQQPAPVLAYQGRLLEATLPVTGTRSFTFAILDGTGAELWNSGAQSVAVNTGLYGVELGAAPMPAIPTSVLAQANLKLRVTVSDIHLSPDTDLVPALQARSAFEVSGAFAGDISGTQNTITLLRLQGIPLDLTTNVPTPGQGLVYNGAKWVPGNVSGTAGPQGPQGFTGPAGAAGAAGTQGIAGPAGAEGVAGPAGAAGANGLDGKTVRNGVGTPAANLGVDGDFFLNTATNVLYGPKGSVTAGQWPASGTNLVGAQGVSGPAGAAGPQGAIGLTGAQGIQGVAGPTGPSGAAGPIGPVGMTFVGTWDTSVAYLPNDVVTIQGATFIANLAGSNHPPYVSSPWWTRIADAGAAGPQGPAGSNPNLQKIAMLMWYDISLTGNYAVPLANGSNSIAYDGSNMLVVNSAGITKLRPGDGGQVGTYPAGVGPHGIAFDGISIWTTNSGPGTVTRLRASDGSLTGTYPAGAVPTAIAFDGTCIWVNNLIDSTVTKLKASDGSLVGTYPVGTSPQGVAFDGTCIWVTNYGSNTVTKLKASDGSMVGTYNTGTGPYGLAFDGTNMWVSISSPGMVAKLKASDGSLLGQFGPSENGRGVAFDGTYIWVSNVTSSTVSRFKASDGTLMGTYATGANPEGIAFDGAHIWVANNGSTTVTKL